MGGRLRRRRIDRRHLRRADAAAARHDDVQVRLRRNFGKAAALQAGFEEAQGDIVVTIDGDLQDDPAEIPRLLAKLEEGFDLVSGWKAKRRDPASRRIPSRIFNRVTGLLSDCGCTTSTAGSRRTGPRC